MHSILPIVTDVQWSVCMSVKLLQAGHEMPLPGHMCIHSCTYVRMHRWMDNQKTSCLQPHQLDGKGIKG